MDENGSHQSTAPYRQSERSQLWEHKTEYIGITLAPYIEEHLNTYMDEMSKTGWELVHATPIESPTHYVEGYRFFWKRLV